jgi:hypothetical protein
MTAIAVIFLPVECTLKIKKTNLAADNVLSLILFAIKTIFNYYFAK